MPAGANFEKKEYKIICSDFNCFDDFQNNTFRVGGTLYFCFLRCFFLLTIKMEV